MKPKSSEKEISPTTCKQKRVKVLSTKKYMVRRQFRSTKRIATKESSPTKCKHGRKRLLSSKKYIAAHRITAQEKRKVDIEEKVNYISKMRIINDFSTSIIRTFKNTTPDLEIEREIVSYLNDHFNIAFSHLAKASAIFALVKKSVPNTTEDIDRAICSFLAEDMVMVGINVGQLIDEKI